MKLFLFQDFVLEVRVDGLVDVFHPCGRQHEVGIRVVDGTHMVTLGTLCDLFLHACEQLVDESEWSTFQVGRPCFSIRAVLFVNLKLELLRSLLIREIAQKIHHELLSIMLLMHWELMLDAESHVSSFHRLD